MKNNIPVIYWTFRYVWTFMHFIIVAAAATALFIWARADDHALRIWETSKTNVLDVQYRVSNVIPWPWAVDDNDSGGSSDSSSYNDQESGESGGEFQVIGNVNVRRAPDAKSKQVDTLSDGTWITVDCVTEGSLVDPGPYQTTLSEYSGQDYGATSLWVHIPGSGYMSDAYVATNNGSGLPQC
jgi:hypothetical protein